MKTHSMLKLQGHSDLEILFSSLIEGHNFRALYINLKIYLPAMDFCSKCSTHVSYLFNRGPRITSCIHEQTKRLILR